MKHLPLHGRGEGEQSRAQYRTGYRLRIGPISIRGKPAVRSKPAMLRGEKELEVLHVEDR